MYIRERYNLLFSHTLFCNNFTTYKKSQTGLSSLKSIETLFPSYLRSNKKAISYVSTKKKDAVLLDQ